MLAFLVGSSLLHSAACTINDICDRDFDRQVGQCTPLLAVGRIRIDVFVERCKNRPIASGAVTVFQATVFLLLQVGLIVWILAQVNRTA